MAKKSLYNNKKGLSTIIVTLLLVVLSLVAIGIAWGFSSDIIKKQISTSQSCFDVSGKFKINGEYTCYNYNAQTGMYSVRFSLSIGDITADKLLIGISSASSTKGYTLTNTPESISELSYVNFAPGTLVKLPDKNGGKTYATTEISTDKIDSIKIAPVISGTQCDIVDSISNIQNCILMGR